MQCETTSRNSEVTFTSSFWDGSNSNLLGCNLINMSGAPLEIIRRFPQLIFDKSYLVLPKNSIANGRNHSGVGIMISHEILGLLLPGSSNSLSEKDKKINSPLIGYTFRYEQSPKFDDDDQVQIVHRHAMEAKDPPFKIIHRNLRPGEIASPVLSAAHCTFLDLRSSNSGVWDDAGCRLVSTNRTHTICQCNHLTGFANLMDFHDYVDFSEGLKITSIVCSVLSVISLLISITLLSILK